MLKKDYKKWKLSSVLHPCKIVDAVCRKFPKEPNKQLILRCVNAGVSRSTASARVSRFRKSLQNKS